MFEFTVLTSTSLTLLVVSLIVLLYLLIVKSKEVDRLRQILHGTIKMMATTHVCIHEFGYLKSYPKGKPIPSECMGCSDIFECLEYRKEKPKTTKKTSTRKKKRKTTSSTKAKTKTKRTTRKKRR